MVIFGIALAHVAGDEAEVVHHHRLVPADPPGDTQRERQRQAALELDLLLRLVELDAIQSGDEIDSASKARRYSPSVAARSPISSCRRIAAAMQRSSTARSASADSVPALRAARASASSRGRSRLPTWSARNGGQAARPDPVLRCTRRGHGNRPPDLSAASPTAQGDRVKTAEATGVDQPRRLSDYHTPPASAGPPH